MTRRSAVALALLLAAACGEHRAPPSPELHSALHDESLGLGLALGERSQLEVDDATGELVRGEVPLRLSPKTQAVTAADVSLTPLEGPARFTAWGPGARTRDAVVYVSPDGRAATVQRLSARGVKEDIVLTRSLGDTLTFRWRLTARGGLVARLEADGSLGLSREGSVRYRIPAPVVKTRSGEAAHAAAFALEGEQLTLTATGLDALDYPLTIDPTVLVTSTIDFAHGGNLEGGADVGSNQVQRGHGGPTVGPWAATTPLFSARQDHATVIYNGYLYVIGGRNPGGSLGDVRYAPIDAAGNVGAFTQSPNALPSVRYDLTAVAYNGWLYVVGGFDLGAYRNDVLAAPLNAGDGSVGPFTVTSFMNGDARSAHATVAHHGYLYIIGGSGQNGANAEIRYAPINGNGTLGSFNTTTPLTSRRHSHSATVWNGRLYVSGGFDADTNLVSTAIESAPFNADGTLGAFTPTTPLPNTRANHATVAYDGYFFLVAGGAQGQFVNSDVQAAPIRADGTLGAFVTATALPFQHTGHGLAASNGRLYVTGGYDSVAFRNEVLQAPLSALDTTTFFTTQSSALPAIRAQHGTAVNNGIVYVTGGEVNGVVSTSTLTAPLNADGSVGAFTTSANTFAIARAEHTTVVFDNTLYVIGGRDASMGLLPSVLKSNIAADGSLGAFTATTPLPAGRYGHASVAHNGFVYVLGGHLTAGDTPEVWFAAVNPDGTLGPWTATTVLGGVGLSGLSAVAYNGYLYAIAGAPGFSTSATILVAPILPTGALGAFTITTSLPNASAEQSAVAHKGHLYVLGGETLSAPLSTVQVAPINLDGTLGAFTAGPNFSLGRGQHTSFVADDRVYLVGGSTGSAQQDVQYTTVNTPGGLTAFAPQSPLTSVRFDHASTSYNGYVYALGGFGLISYQNDVLVAPVTAAGVGAFTTTSPFTTPRQGHSAVAAAGYVYVLGGSDPAMHNDVQVAAIGSNGTLGGFAATTPFTTARQGHSSVVWKNRLYVVGGYTGTVPLADVQVATIASNGTLGTFAPTTSFATARYDHASVAYNGYLYVIGGTTGVTGRSDVQVAPINADGTLGAFVLTTSLPARRAEAAAAAYGGYLYVVGGQSTGYLDEVLVAPINSNGTLGTFTSTQKLGGARKQHTAVIEGGRLIVMGGIDSGSTRLADVQAATLRTPAPLGVYSKLFDMTAAGTATSLTLNGSAVQGSVQLSYRVANASGAFGSPISRGTVALGTPVPLGNTNVRYVLARFTLDDTLAAAVNPDATNVRDVGDVTLSYNLNPIIAPAGASVPPRGSRAFSCSSGSGGYLYSLPTNGSNGSVIAATGAYTAGATPNQVDVVRCTDSVGLTSDATVTVGAGVSITPLAPTVPPRVSRSFTAMGGSNLGFTWAITTNNSMGSIVAATGLYTAGATPSVVDTLTVTDSLGNTASTTVNVGPAASIMPASITLPPRGSASFTASGGNGAFTFSLVSTGSGTPAVTPTGSYTAGNTGSSTDAVRASDDAGNTATATITVTAGVSIAPPSAMVTPRGTQTFTASGGSDAGFTWTMFSAPSGGAIDAAGVYVAGSNGALNDVVQVTDSLGNQQTATVMVGPGVSITPSGASTAPLGTVPFSAMGGSGSGFVWSLVTNVSGATLNPSTGAYQAGATMGTDTVRVTDSLGNTTTVTVTVTNALAVTPPAPSVAPRSIITFTSTGGSRMGLVWSLVTNNSGATFDPQTATYTAGPTGLVMDTVQVVDSLGAMATATIRLTAAAAIAPAAPSVTPRGAQTFSASGGSGTGFVWSLMTNASGGTINSSSGAYVAGSTGGVTDVVRVTDSLGATATANVTVGPGVSITPAMPMVAPRASQQFTATGGTDAGFTWTLVNRSGGTIDPFTGAYTAGPTGSVTDVVGARDPLGNTGTVDVMVSSGLTVLPTTLRVPPKGSLQLSVTGGTSPFTWELTQNNSGGALAANGLFTAGATPSVTDTVKVTDQLGNSTQVSITITAGVVVTPATQTVGPGSTLQLAASGGSDTGFTWELTTNGSGGTVAADGTYTAGTTAATTDVVRATDSLGNTGTSSISVVAGAMTTEVPYSQRPPVSGWPCGCNSSPLAGMLGLAVLVLRRRGKSGWLLLAMLVALPAFAAAPAAKKGKAKQPPAPAVVPAPAPAPAPPPPEPVAAPAPAPKPKPEKLSVAVLDVEVTVPNEKLDGAAFSEMLTSSIDGTGMFRVISSKEIATMLGMERQRQLLGCTEDTSCMAEIANALGTDLVAVATVGRVGNTYLVSVKLIDGRTSRTAARASTESNDPNLLLKAIWSASQDMLEKYGAALEPEMAAKWASRPKQSAPAQLVAAETTSVPQYFGVSLGVVGGIQLFSAPGNRGSIAAEVDVTYRRQRLDISAGLVVAPNLGVRVAIAFAVLASRLRIDIGVRGTGYPGLGLYGGGLMAVADFSILSWLSIYALGAAEAYPTKSAPVLVLLGTVGPAARF